MFARRTLLALAVTLITSGGLAAAPLSPPAVEALMRKSACFTCHTPHKKKDGPSFREIAANFRNKLDADATLMARLQKHGKVKIHGVEEDHDPIKSKNPDELKSVVKWIRSQ